MHFTHYLANRIRSFNTAAGGVCLPAGTHSPLVIIINSILIFFEVVQLHSVHSHAATYAIPGIINTQTQGTHVTIQGVYLGVWCLCSHVTGCLQWCDDDEDAGWRGRGRGRGGQPGPSAALDTAPGTRYRYRYTTTVYTLSVATSGEADYIVNCDTNILHVLKKLSDNAVIGGYLLQINI